MPTRFSMKPEITAEDEEILEFMMLSTDERVLSSIACCLTRHSNKEMVLRFLVDRLSTGSEPKANFLAGLGMLAEGNAVRPVKALHDRLAVEINRDASMAGEEMVRDFLMSCAVLNKLEVSTSHRSEIESFLHDHRESMAASPNFGRGQERGWSEEGSQKGVRSLLFFKGKWFQEPFLLSSSTS